MSCYMTSSGIATKVASEMQPKLDRLKSELKGNFAASTKRQDEMQAQLNDIQRQLTELLDILKPGDISKPSLVKKQTGTQP